MRRMKHALFIAFHYPPEASSSGVLRTLKYSRYLEEYGWRVTVISPHVDAYAVTDATLEVQIPASAKVIRTPFLNTKRSLSIGGVHSLLLALPDPWIGWLPWAVAAGRRVARDDPFDLVYSTNPHATAHLIARRVARSSGRPWVTDFRDPWYEGPAEPALLAEMRWRQRLDETVERKAHCRLERGVVGRCSDVVTSTLQLRDMMRARYPEKADRITTILNGYDEADFSALNSSAGGAAGDRLTIVHAGIINDQFRDPRPIFRALRRAAVQGVLDLRRLCLRFIGGGAFADSDAVRASVAENELNDCVEFVPRIPYEQSLTEIARADLLLLLQASKDTADLVPAKLYEYLRAQKPVLAVVFPGSAGEVLAAVGGGWAVDPREEDALLSALASAFQRWAAGNLGDKCADLASLRRFDRRVLTGDLAAIFDRLTPVAARAI